MLLALAISTNQKPTIYRKLCENTSTVMHNQSKREDPICPFRKQNLSLIFFSCAILRTNLINGKSFKNKKDIELYKLVASMPRYFALLHLKICHHPFALWLLLHTFVVSSLNMLKLEHITINYKCWTWKQKKEKQFVKHIQGRLQ